PRCDAVNLEYMRRMQVEGDLKTRLRTTIHHSSNPLSLETHGACRRHPTLAVAWANSSTREKPSDPFPQSSARVDRTGDTASCPPTRSSPAPGRSEMGTTGAKPESQTT